MFGRLADWVARLLARTGRWEAPTADPAFGYLCRAVIARVAELTGDRRGHLRAGGVVVVVDQATLDALADHVEAHLDVAGLIAVAREGAAG